MEIEGENRKGKNRIKTRVIERIKVKERIE